jgi:cytochrome b6-f complex iron-sulfur subunit
MSCQECPGNGHNGKAEMSRRNFFAKATAGVLGIGGGLMGVFSLAFLRPRVASGAPSKFRVGRPGTYSSGSQVEYTDDKVLVRREGDKFAAISTICTHLGCTVKATEIGFECPCHGSIYDRQGGNISGPAPEPLLWFRIQLATNGELVVDKREIVDVGTYLEVSA